MSEMINRVAKAIENAGDVVGAFYPISDDEMAVIACAAIEAMREPTNEMNKEGAMNYTIMDAGGRIDHEQDIENSVIACIWDAMIDAALRWKVNA